MNKPVVSVEQVSKRFKKYSSPYKRVLEWATFGRTVFHQDFWALKDISFKLDKGEVLGIIGDNGAGKSTLLKIISRTLHPTTGTVTTSGSLVSLLELGTGFNPELSGVDNIYQSAQLMGYTKEFVDSKIEQIINFSELGKSVNEPVKNYSSGMFVRLAFSLFASLEPDIYIVDEALSVGDIFFQQKCFQYLQTLKEKGCAIIFVTHDMQTVLKFCDRVIILKDGMISNVGNPREMVNLYYASGGNDTELNEFHEANLTAEGFIIEEASIANITNSAGLRRGDGTVKIIGAEVYNEEWEIIRTVKTGETINLRIYAECSVDVDDLTFGFQISDRFNTVVFGQNSYMCNKVKLSGSRGEIIRANFEIKLDLFQGVYTILLAATNCNLEATNTVYDWVESVFVIEVLRPEWRSFHGVSSLQTKFVASSQTRD